MSLNIYRTRLYRIASSQGFRSILSRSSGAVRCQSIPGLAQVSIRRSYFRSSINAQQQSPAARLAFEDASAGGIVEDDGSIGASRGTSGLAFGATAATISQSNRNDLSAFKFEDEIKSIVQHIPYAIVVLTTGAKNNVDSWRGMTLSSFTTISMRPTPLATINIKTPSHTLTQLMQSRRCVINILLRNKDGIKCASTFANPNSPIAIQREQFSIDDHTATAGSVSGREQQLYYGPPLREDAVYFSLGCSVHKTLPVQDHTLVVLEIVGVDHNGRRESLHDHEALFYKRRDYDLISEGTKAPFNQD